MANYYMSVYLEKLARQPCWYYSCKDRTKGCTREAEFNGIIVFKSGELWPQLLQTATCTLTHKICIIQ